MLVMSRAYLLLAGGCTGGRGRRALFDAKIWGTLRTRFLRACSVAGARSQ